MNRPKAHTAPFGKLRLRAAIERADALEVGISEVLAYFGIGNIGELAKGLTGSGLMALGFLASHKGYLTSGLTDDKKISGLEKAEGKQNFALNLKDYTVSLESFPPWKR